MDGEHTLYIYKECQRNHAAVLGAYSTDGCNEYIRDAAKPHGMFCQACECHRNFHHKVSVLMDASYGDAPDDHDDEHQQSSIPTSFSNKESNFKDKERVADVIDLLSDDDEEFPISTPVQSKPTPDTKIKRKRLTEEQKQKMRRVCKIVEWKLPGIGTGSDEINRLCQEIGITRDTFRKFLYKERVNVS